MGHMAIAYLQCYSQNPGPFICTNGGRMSCKIFRLHFPKKYDLKIGQKFDIEGKIF